MIKPVQSDIIGDTLAIRWSDQSEQFIPLKKLREACPCASCKGEPGIAGPSAHEQPVNPPLTDESFQLTAMNPVGGYGVQIVWGDGHSAGIYSYDYLRSLS